MSKADALAFARSKASSDVSRKIVNEFLSQLDGFDSANDQVLILAATNMPWDVDPAMKRPGRFARQVFVPPPDAVARTRIIELALESVPHGAVDAAAIARVTEQFSGADVDALAVPGQRMQENAVARRGDAQAGHCGLQAVDLGFQACHVGIRLALFGSTLGLIGYGNIAHEVARRALAFGLRVVVWSRRFMSGSQVPDLPLTVLPSASAVSIAGSRLGSFMDRRSCAKKRCLVPSNTENAADLAPELSVSPLSVSTIRVASRASRRRSAARTGGSC